MTTAAFSRLFMVMCLPPWTRPPMQLSTWGLMLLWISRLHLSAFGVIARIPSRHASLASGTQLLFARGVLLAGVLQPPTILCFPPCWLWHPMSKLTAPNQKVKLAQMTGLTLLGIVMQMSGLKLEQPCHRFCQMMLLEY